MKLFFTFVLTGTGYSCLFFMVLKTNRRSLKLCFGCCFNCCLACSICIHVSLYVDRCLYHSYPLPFLPPYNVFIFGNSSSGFAFIGIDFVNLIHLLSYLCYIYTTQHTTASLILFFPPMPLQIAAKTVNKRQV